MLVTVFTPTYNRAHTLQRLYDSLKKQCCKDFEWVVIDDGSSDNTQDLIASFQAEQIITINYTKTKNGGKQRAINHGSQIAKGALFFIVDSDDYLTEDAIEQIAQHAHHEHVGGLCFRRINYNTGRVLGGNEHIEDGNYNSLEIHYKLGVSADKAEVFKTDLIRHFPFPVYDGENFIPEAYIWNRIGKSYKLRFINQGIYMCEYLEDGLTHNFKANLKKNPKGFALYYRDMLNYRSIPLMVKIKAIVRLIQCKLYLLRR